MGLLKGGLMVYGYLRVSTSTQKIDNQKLQISQSYNVNKWVVDVGSGSKINKNLEYLLLKKIKSGDMVIVTALDRLGRNMTECSKFKAIMDEKGVSLVSLREGLDFSTPSGSLAFNIAISMAEFERKTISERIIQGLDRVRSEGKKLGAPRKVSQYEEAQIVCLARYAKNKYNCSYREILNWQNED